MTFQVGWGHRALGLVVLACVAGVTAGMGSEIPWPSAIVLGVFGLAALLSTLSNFGERVHAGEEGLLWENVLLRRLGLRRGRRAAWSEILAAVELDGKTLFVTVEGQRRWVLDALENVDALRELLRQHGVPVELRSRPRIMDLGRGPRQPPS